MAERNSWASHIIWGSVAVCAVLAAAVMIALAVGSHRGIQVAAPAKRPVPVAMPAQLQAKSQAAVPAPVIAPPVKSSEHEIARLNDALRALASERDRLAERLEAVERTVGDITASVPRASAIPESNLEVSVTPSREPSPASEIPRPQPAEPARSASSQTSRGKSSATATIGPVPGEIFQPYAAAQPVVTPPVPGQAAMQIHAAPPLQLAPQAAPGAIVAPQRESVATRTEFGVELGTEPSMDGLRARWSNLRGNHGNVLANLRPLVSVSDGNRPGSIELRLIAGPFANAGDAARACAALRAKEVNCQTTVFDGQRLALR